jgi:Flp pilus assembly protein TadD
VGAGAMLSGCAGTKPAARAAGGLPPVMQRQVLNAVDAGEGNAAVRRLRAKMAEHPGDVKLRLELAGLYGEQGFAELELEHLRVAAERFPDAEAAVFALVRALLRSGQNDEAARAVSALLDRSDKPSADALSWAGIVQDESGHLAMGEVYHRRAIERAPGRDALHNNLGQNLLLQSRNGEAAESFRRALELNPGSETARNNLGVALAGRPAEAVGQFKQVSDLGVAHNNLGAYLYEKGDMAGARREFELALEYRKDMPVILENLRRVAAIDGKPIRMEGVRRESSVLQSIARGLKKIFIAGEEKSVPGAAEAAR